MENTQFLNKSRKIGSFFEIKDSDINYLRGFCTKYLFDLIKDISLTLRYFVLS